MYLETFTMDVARFHETSPIDRSNIRQVIKGVGPSRSQIILGCTFSFTHIDILTLRVWGTSEC